MHCPPADSLAARKTPLKNFICTGEKIVTQKNAKIKLHSLGMESKQRSKCKNTWEENNQVLKQTHYTFFYFLFPSVLFDQHGEI